MVWSKYTYMFDDEGKYYIYNSLSNGFAEIDKTTYDEISRMKRDNNILSINDELLVQLKKLKVIVDNDKDEINAVKYLTLRRRNDDSRLILTINPTLSCNFACPYCFEGEHPNRFMTDEVEDKIIRFIQSNPKLKTISVTWFGGEPLLAFDRIVSLTKKMQSLGLAYSAGMITNGYLLTETVAAQLQDLSISSVQITIDGLASFHDSRRCLKSGKPTFEQIVKNIDFLQTHYPSIAVRVRVNVDKTNMEDFLGLYKFLKDKRYPNLTINLAFVKDMTGCHNCNSSFDTEEQAQIAKTLLQKYGLDFSMVYPLSDRYECAIRNKNALVIGPEGELYKCWNDVGNQDKVVGTIDGKITNERLLLRYLIGADPFESPKCQKCFLLPVCGGGCPYSRIQNEYEGTDISTCLFMKKHLKDFLLAHANYKNLKCNSK